MRRSSMCLRIIISRPHAIEIRCFFFLWTRQTMRNDNREDELMSPGAPVRIGKYNKNNSIHTCFLRKCVRIKNTDNDLSRVHTRTHNQLYCRIYEDIT